MIQDKTWRLAILAKEYIIIGTYISFGKITVNFKGKKISLESAISGRKAIINMQNDDNECLNGL